MWTDWTHLGTFHVSMYFYVPVAPVNRTTLALLICVFVTACNLDEPPSNHDHSAPRTQTLLVGTSASFQSEPFQQVGFFVDTAASNLDVRIDGGAWRPVDITWSEGIHKVGRVLLDSPATQMELRSEKPWSFGTVEFYDDIVATDVLTRDLPKARPEFGSNLSALAPATLVIPRAAWGARDPNKVCGVAHVPYRMAIHHTALPEDDGGDAAARMRQIQAYHIDSNGWCDIGYHFVISQAGQAYQGNSNEQRTGAHVLNHNTGNIGICLIGNFEVQALSDTQMNKAAEVAGWVGRTYGIAFDRASIKGHREHSGNSTACPGTNTFNRLDELVAKAAGIPTTPKVVAFDVNFIGEQTDFYQAGSSTGKPDFFEGDTVQAEIRFTNTTQGPLRNVSLDYVFESPFLSATNYQIESDAPAFAGAFALNDADANPTNPAKNALGDQGSLGLYAMGAGETKRVIVDLNVGEYSIGLVDHPDLRAWVRHIDGLYEDQGAFDEEPSVNSFDGLLQNLGEIDILSRNEWQFDAGEPEQVEGWFSCRGEAPTVDVAQGALTVSVGPSDCIEAPRWAKIDTTTWDQIVVRMKVEGDHKAAIYWGVEGDSYTVDRAVSFDVSPDTETYVIPVGKHTGWTGEVSQLRIVPSLRGSTVAAIDAVFVQSSNGEVGSTREAFVAQTPVSTGVDVTEPAPDLVVMEPGVTPATPDNDVEPTFVEDQTITTESGGCTTAGGSPLSLIWLLGFFVMVRRR
jgi:hypothetical protein